MPIVDMHAHITPEPYKEAIRTRGEWYGLDARPGELDRGGFAKPLVERIAEMDALGVDMQVLTPGIGFYQYDNDLETTKAIHRECNNYVAEAVEQHPSRFLGMGTVPMQDPSTAIAEMARGMNDLGLKGVIINDHVVGRTYDDPSFLPFFAAAEELGAILFFHQGWDTCVEHRNTRYKLPNAIGNLTERTLVYATLVFGGIIDRFPDLKPLLGHGGGYTAYGASRMDKVAGALEGDSQEMTPPFGGGAGFSQQLPPSDYLERFYYDCCTYSGSVLRFLIDAVGIDQVVLGTDYPAPMVLPDAVEWIRGLPELSEAEKEAILANNPTRLVGL
ncbi:MAG: amidohydrolase family protein [Acidimicrobiia bacterium]